MELETFVKMSASESYFFSMLLRAGVLSAKALTGVKTKLVATYRATQRADTVAQ